MLSLNTSFSSGSLEFRHMPGRRYLCDQPPHKNPGHWASKGLPWKTIFHTCYHYSLLRIKHILCDSTERKPWKLVSNFLWTLPHHFSSSLNFLCSLLHLIINMAICWVLRIPLVNHWTIAVLSNSDHWVIFKNLDNQPKHR